MHLPKYHYHLSPTRPNLFWSRSSPQSTLRSPIIFNLILGESEKIRPENYHEFRILKYMVKLRQKNSVISAGSSEASERHCVDFLSIIVGHT